MQKGITEEMLYMSVRELANLIRARRLSPVALAEAYLDRLEKLGPKLGATITITRQIALEQARIAQYEIQRGRYRGPLHGIPYGVKDLVATRGTATTWGAAPYVNQIFDYDATIIKKLNEAGAVMVAKLAMVELAGGFGYNNADASFTGPGRTPWNKDFWSGGSSSGPGAATAGALVAFSIGSETSGSIITPSAFCGVSGLRPTYGRVSRYGAMALSWTLDKLGPMCRTADDCGLVLAAIAGRDYLDPTSIDKPFVYPERAGRATRARGRNQKFRIGVIKGAAERVQPEVKKNFEQSLEALSRFADVKEEVEFPDMPFGQVVSTIVAAEGASAFRDLVETGRSRELRAANDRWGGYASSMVLAVDYLQAMRIRGPMKRIMDELYSKYDALVAPSRATVSYPIGVDFDKAYPGISGGPAVIPAGNAVGQPAISVPNGFGANNLPTGIQLTGRAWSEARLLEIANAYQQATDWHKQRPPLEKIFGI
ncbi:MAG: amidase [Blastocatellia bacterium]|nr:amidase [Blastocatellia bacterium]